MLYLVIEKYKDENPVPVYRRFRAQGRRMPDGLRYVSSWVNESITRCYQIMETDHYGLLEEWMKNWDDIVEFEVLPVLTSEEASRKMAPHL